LLDQDLPTAELRGMLRMKREELREHVQDEMARLERVETRLKQLEQEVDMSNYDVLLKKVEPTKEIATTLYKLSDEYLSFIAG
jgi:DNA-binding transcriptional MerR regulator